VIITSYIAKMIKPILVGGDVAVVEVKRSAEDTWKYDIRGYERRYRRVVLVGIWMEIDIFLLFTRKQSLSIDLWQELTQVVRGS
jgi:hypothetical protein